MNDYSFTISISRKFSQVLRRKDSTVVSFEKKAGVSSAEAKAV